MADLSLASGGRIERQPLVPDRSYFSTFLIQIMPWLEEETPLLPHQEAAILLEYARDGQDLNGSNLTLRSRACYRLRHKFQWLFRLAAWSMIALHIFERPKWTYTPGREDFWKDNELYPSFQIHYLNPVAVNVLTLLCLGVLWMGVCLEFGYKRFTSNVNLVYLSSAVLAMKTITVLGCLIKIGVGGDPTFSASPVEALMCLLVEQQYDNNIGYIRRTVPKFGVLMLVLVCFIGTYTAVGLLIFDPDSQEALQYFPTVGTAFWNMLMVLNGSNWPSPMMPAVHTSRLYCLYFYMYIVIVGWGLLNLVLGFVYLFFQKEQKSILDMQEQTRVDNRAAAFRIMDVEKKGFLTYPQVDQLLQEMYEFYEEMRDAPSAAERYELILVLDIQSNLMIDENDFSFIEQKCFKRALKVMRAKKRKFTRYLLASILTDKLYGTGDAGSSAISTEAGSDAPDTALPTLSPLQQKLRGDASRFERDDSISDSDGGSNSEVGYGGPPALDFLGSGALARDLPPAVAAAIARAHASALADEVGVQDRRLSTDRMSRDRMSRDSSRLSCGDAGREARFSTNIENASKYAGKIDDPKLLELYRDIQTQALLQQGSGGPTWSQRVAYYSMYVDVIYFDIVADCFLLLFGIAVLIHPEETRTIYAYITFALLEMGIKLLVKGQHRYWRSNRNSVDGFVALGLFALAMGDASMRAKAYSEVGTKTLVLLRTMMFPRNIIVTNGFRDFRNRHRLAFIYGFQSASHFTFLLLVLFVMIYIYAGIGQKVFGGAICTSGAGADRVEASAFGQSAYWPLNFNDMPSGMVTMFTLLSVNNMHITTSGFVAAYSQWAELFFASWYALGVLLLLNVLTAVFVNQFTGYMSRLAQEKQLAEEQQEQDEREEKLRLAEEYPDLDADDTREPQLSSDTAASSGFSREARRNTALNTRLPWDVSAIDAADGAVAGTAGTDESDQDFISMSKTTPPGVLFSLARPSVSWRDSSATPRETPRPSFLPSARSSYVVDPQSRPIPVPGQRSAGASEKRPSAIGSLTTIASSTGIGRLLKLLAVEDEPELQDLHPPMLPPTSTATEGAKARKGSVYGAKTRAESPSPAPNSGPNPVTGPSPVQRSMAPLDGRQSPMATPRQSLAGVSDRLTISSRARASTIGAEADDAAATATSFNASIFASTSDRQKLQEWVLSHLPRPRRQSAAPAGATEAELSYGSVATVHNASTSIGKSQSDKTSNRGDHRRALDTQRIISKLVVPADPNVRLSLDGGQTSDDEGDDAGNADMLDAEPSQSFSPPKSSTKRHRARAGESVHESSKASGEFELTPCSSQNTSPKDSEDIVAEELVNPLGQGRIQGAPDDTTAASSTHEELRHLRGKSVSFLRRTFLPARGKHAELSLQEWMYSSNQIAAHEKAAVLVQFARDGEEHSIFSSPRGLACYRLRTTFGPLFKLCSFLYALLKFFQRPLWTYYHERWQYNSEYPMSGMPQLSATTIGALKLPILLVILCGLLLELGYKESNLVNMFLRMNGMRLLRLALFLYCVAQIFMVLAAISGGPPHLVPMTSFGCMLYVLWFNRRSLHKFRIVLRVLPRLSLVLMAFLLMVVLFAAFGPYLLNLRTSGEDDDMNQVYFNTFADSSWSVFVAITSSNYPNQILPAYRENREVFLYFFAFISIGAFGMLNLILVLVLVEFQRASQLATDIQRASRQVLLMRAFEVLDPEGVGSISRAQIMLLLDELYLHYADFRKAGVPKGAARDILVDILDVDGDGKITVHDFLFFLDVMRVKVSKESDATFVEKNFPAVAASYAFQLLCRTVRHPYFNLIVDTTVAVMILSNIFINSKNAYRQTATSVAIAYTVVEIVTAEVAAKVLVRGWSSYKRSFRNRLDFPLAIGAFICMIGSIGCRSVGRVNGFTILMRVLLMLRLFMYPRNIRYFFENRGLKRFARLLRRILSKTLTISIVFLCTGYVFASVGLFLYGGLIDKSPVSNSHYDQLVTSRYGIAGYYALNFNDFMSACITLFCCLHVSDFDIIASGFTATTTENAKGYFALWYMVGVLLMLNILKSFFLGEFLALFLVPGAEGSMLMSGVQGRGESLQRKAQDQSDEEGSAGQLAKKGEEGTYGNNNQDIRDTYVLGPSPVGTLYGRPTVAGMRPDYPNPDYRQSSATSEVSSAAPGRQGSSACGSRQVSNAAGEHEYDEEQYKKISLTRSGSSVASDRNRSLSSNTRYFASTAKVKNLDIKDREQLRQRIRQLAEGNAVSPSPNPAPPSI